ncbi:hypothetical protein C1X49_05125 [Pseudomonas sp. MPR-E5]|nr:hypothetical protein C1X49_05125 [Pseudomonas sp. MPR-E5]
MASDQSATMLNVLTPSRAGSLLQGFCELTDIRDEPRVFRRLRSLSSQQMIGNQSRLLERGALHPSTASNALDIQ